MTHVTTKQTRETKDLHQQVTDQIIEALSQSASWIMPWHQKALTLPKNVTTKKPYRGINILSLWAAAHKNRYNSFLWGTYNQWKSLGIQVRKGEKGHTIVFYKDFEVEEKNKETGEFELVKRFVLKASTVFNASQVDGFNTPIEPQSLLRRSFYTLDRAEEFVVKTEAKIVNSFTSAFYHYSQDVIGMPAEDLFMETSNQTEEENYFSTLFHELIHWTGHKSRLDRISPAAHFGSENYAVEELIAELGAAFLCAELGVSTYPRQDHANYIASWLKILKNDKKAIFHAARKATQAVDYLRKLQPPEF